MRKKHKGWILILTGLFIFSLQACTDKSRNNVNFNEVAAENSVSPETEASSQILEDCVYATTGDMTGAAIGRDGSLYTWGLNIFGECGAEVTSDDFLRTPKKTLENVCMVWPEKIFFNSLEEEIPQAADYRTTYSFNTFALLDDGTVVAAGKDIGDKEKEIAVTGDLVQTTSHVYSDTFLPVTLEEFSIKIICKD